MALDPVSLATQAVGTAGSVVGDIYNVFANERNYQRAIDQQNYERELQRTMFAREDNAVQRRAADLKAAGINPLLAAGSSAQAGPVVSTSAPEKGKINLSSPQQLIDLVAKNRSIDISNAQIELLKAQAENARKTSESIDLQNAAKIIDIDSNKYDLDVKKTVPPWMTKTIGVIESVIPGVSGLIGKFINPRKRGLNFKSGSFSPSNPRPSGASKLFTKKGLSKIPKKFK